MVRQHRMGKKSSVLNSSFLARFAPTVSGRYAGISTSLETRQNAPEIGGVQKRCLCSLTSSLNLKPLTCPFPTKILLGLICNVHQPWPSWTDFSFRRSGIKPSRTEEEILRKTRAKQHWLKEGDNNTKFFHAVANGRKRSNEIQFIEDESGRLIRNEAQMKSCFFHSFKRLFGWAEDEPSSFGDWADLYQADALSDLISAPFNLDEVKKAIFQLGSDKAPGPDGFPPNLFPIFLGDG
ncbi:hypothetical protein ACMD2_27251 [Ananas comosus]|uniref:Reverse transcriptase domain-containing protein n=1 Tax=Ananas comosus TaxID=4615 RepID=A0A199VCM4_ANACO|nr:hypothetical protein ACMD2_27251 [Ananas comosus]